MSAWTERNLTAQLWNHGIRHLGAAPELPPNPIPRRHGFKVGTVWLLAVGVLLALGQATGALILGVMLLGACGLLTATNFCLPSTLLAIWRQRREAASPATQLS